MPCSRRSRRLRSRPLLARVRASGARGFRGTIGRARFPTPNQAAITSGPFGRHTPIGAAAHVALTQICAANPAARCRSSAREVVASPKTTTMSSGSPSSSARSVTIRVPRAGGGPRLRVGGRCASAPAARRRAACASRRRPSRRAGPATPTGPRRPTPVRSRPTLSHVGIAHSTIASESLVIATR